MPISKRAASSSRVKISSSVPGDQPRKARKFTNASGRYPSSRYAVIAVCDLRLLILLRSGLRMSGMCPKRGSRYPRALMSAMCLGVLLR